jgi:hypothetical protein
MARENTNVEAVKHWDTAEPNRSSNENHTAATRSKHQFGYVAVFLAAMVLTALAHVRILRGIGSLLMQLGVKKVPQWELARAVLIQQGVREAAIIIPEDDAVGTLEELQAVCTHYSKEHGARSSPGFPAFQRF